MMEFVDTVEEGVNLSAYTNELTAWLQQCYELLDSGNEGRIPSDPFFDSGMTDAQVDTVIAAIDEEFVTELGSFPSYHRNRSGANALPEFHRLSPSARRAMVEGCLVIKNRHKALSEAKSTAQNATVTTDMQIEG